jgi:hypothetical protein
MLVQAEVDRSIMEAKLRQPNLFRERTAMKQ